MEKELSINNGLSLHITAPCESEMGMMIYDVACTSNLVNLLSEYTTLKSFNLHQGDMHTLILEGETEEILDFLRILREQYPTVAGDLFKMQKMFVMGQVRVTYIKKGKPV